MIIIIFLFGLCIGSFINAFVFRLHEKRNARYKKINLSILNGRSICPNCKHQLSAIDLVPVFSWLLLGGKCRYCGHKISIQYPLIEVLTAVIFVISYIKWPYSFSFYGWLEFSVWLLLASIFIILAVYDYKWLILPNKIVFYLTIIGLLELFLLNYGNGIHFMGILLAIGAGFLISFFFYFLFILSKGQWIGGGDVKIAFVLGILAGNPINALSLIFIASLLGTFFSIPSLINRKRKINSHIPFGPFLILATFIVFIFASNITSIYHNLYF